MLKKASIVIEETDSKEQTENETKEGEKEDDSKILNKGYQIFCVEKMNSLLKEGILPKGKLRLELGNQKKNSFYFVEGNYECSKRVKRKFFLKK